MKAKEIVEENFRGLDELIDDKDLSEFYKDLIVTCMEDYSESKNKELIEGWKFCPNCGNKLQNQISTDINTKLICVNSLCKKNYIKYRDYQTLEIKLNDAMKTISILRKDANEADHADYCMCRFCAPEFHKLKTKENE